jgi:hypothetical protein
MESTISADRQWRKLKALACVLLLLSITATAARCQTWNEWWSQSKTQRNYLLQQIAALQVYTGYLHQGYEIAGKGLGTVKDLKNGELGLHTAFYNSLKAVNPAIRGNEKVTGIIAFQAAISKAFDQIGNSGLLDLSDRQYIAEVKTKVMDECDQDLQELLLAVSPGKVEMTDDERIKRLDKVYEAMHDKSAFAQSFCHDANLLIWQKANERSSVNELRRYYETH